MKTKTKAPGIFLFMLILISACAPYQAVPTPIPGVVYTIVAATNAAAWTQTAAFWPTATSTPSPTKTPRATPTPITPTATFILYSPTPPFTETPTATATREPVTAWPDWKTGTVVDGKGLGGGTTKMFNILVNVQVIVVRGNGVKLRSIPSNAVGGPMADYGELLTLTGRMNKNKEFGWLYAEVRTGGSVYWVGGTEGDGNAEPEASLRFYNP